MFDTEEQLDDFMTHPSDSLMEFVCGIRSPLVVLGGSGKMGPSLAVMAARAAYHAGHDLEVIVVARFSDEAVREWLGRCGVTTVRCDLLNRSQVMALPAAQDVIYMAGRKFGTTDNPALTWAMNTLAPAYAAERYDGARIVALSTGCVYPLVPVAGGGSRESDELTPLGEYSNACVARERVFEYCAAPGTPLLNVRLNYAVDLRYGVLVDIATKVLADEPIDLTMGYFNCIWQGDANDMIIRSLALARTPAVALNLTGRAVLSVRSLAERFGELLGRQPRFIGSEGAEALLSDPSLACSLLGEPATSIDDVVRWTASWLQRGGRTLGKPTHYEASDGRY